MTIEERLEKIEKKVKRNNLILLAVVLLAVLAMTVGANSHKKVIEASAFNLIDENGKIRARLCMLKEGPVLRLYDEYENPRAAMGVAKEGPVLSLADEKGEVRAGLNASKRGPALGLYDENGKIRAILGRNKVTTPDGKVISYPESSLLMFDPNERVIWVAP